MASTEPTRDGQRKSTKRTNVLYFAGRPIALWKKVGTSTATISYLVTDHLGTPIATVLPSSSGLDWTGGFEPFGRDWQEGTSQDASAKGILLRLPGQWDDPLWDSATLGENLYYNLHRWYETQSGRYTSADPIAWFSRGAFLYGYAESAPLNSSDPSGLVAVKCEGCLEISRFLLSTERILNNLRTRGTPKFAPSTGITTRGVAGTSCVDLSSLGGGSAVPVTTFDDYPFGTHPCIHSCISVHERVHRRQCRLLGPEKYNDLPDKVAEPPAYEETIKCLLSAKRNGSLDLELSGVSY
jgi:RHS repeat-associated protein